MANEKLPRTPTTRRTTTTPRTTRTATATQMSPAVPVPNEPATPTARNAVSVDANPGNAGIDLDAVRRRAYQLYEERGRLDGYHEQDWYTAEQELRRKQSRSQNGRAADTKRSA